MERHRNRAFTRAAVRTGHLALYRGEFMSNEEVGRRRRTGRRDTASLAVMTHAGLRVSEVCKPWGGQESPEEERWDFLEAVPWELAGPESAGKFHSRGDAGSPVL